MISHFLTNANPPNHSSVILFSPFLILECLQSINCSLNQIFQNNASYSLPPVHAGDEIHPGYIRLMISRNCHLSIRYWIYFILYREYIAMESLSFCQKFFVTTINRKCSKRCSQYNCKHCYRQNHIATRKCQRDSSYCSLYGCFRCVCHHRK